MDKGKLLGMVGLARKASFVEPGADKAHDAAQGRRAKLVLLSEDASTNTKKRVNDFCKYYKVPLATPGITSEELGNAIGMGETAVAAITDGGMASAIIKITGVIQW